jgi:thiosulfate/3-mercaptopyruvate sulfurtransferase
MNARQRQHTLRCLSVRLRSTIGTLLVTVAVVAVTASCSGDVSGSASSGWPWGTDSVSPADFAKELASASGTDKPVVVCTAPAFLYRVAHIPGSVFHGPASSPEGLSSLTAWAQPLPRSTSIVIYCGCCPLAQCPNLAPAYAALKKQGFTRVRVLLIQDNFKIDWIDRGYPYER